MKKDIYSIFSAYDAEKNQGYFKIMINPLVNWVWIGGIVMVLVLYLLFGHPKGETMELFNQFFIFALYFMVFYLYSTHY